MKDLSHKDEVKAYIEELNKMDLSEADKKQFLRHYLSDYNIDIYSTAFNEGTPNIDNFKEDEIFRLYADNIGKLDISAEAKIDAFNKHILSTSINEGDYYTTDYTEEVTNKYLYGIKCSHNMWVGDYEVEFSSVDTLNKAQIFAELKYAKKHIALLSKHHNTSSWVIEPVTLMSVGSN